MSLEREFQAQWQTAPKRLTRVLTGAARSPSERNLCYAHGYLTALYEAGQISNRQEAYWRAALGSLESEPAGFIADTMLQAGRTPR